MVTLASRAFSNLAASEGAERRSSPAPLRAPDDAPRRGSAAAAALDDDERRLRRRESQALGAAADRVTPSPAALKRMSQVGLAPPGAGHLSISAIAKLKTVLKSKAKQAREHTQQNRKKRAAIVDTRAHHDDADGDADDDDRERPPAVKSAASKAAILDALRDHRYFSAIPTKELLRMAKTTLEVGAYGAGATFGELALLYRAPRAATIRALEDCRCWVVDSKTFRKVVIDARRAQESSRADFLRKLPLFADFDFVFLSRLANSLETCRFQRGEAIIRQGDVGESMFIIEAGAVKVEQSAGFRTRHLVTLRPGDYFGEMALLHNLPRAATCIAECEEDEVVKCVSMRRSHFESLFGNLKDMMERQVKRRILKSLVIFEAVSDAAIDVAAEKMRVAEYARGDSIVVEGEEGNKLFIIQKGRVKVTKATFNDRDEVSGQTQLGILEDNACFGEKSLVESGPRNATVTALSEAVVCYWLGRREYELCIENQEAPDEDVAEADAAQSAPEAPRFVVSDPSTPGPRTGDSTSLQPETSGTRPRSEPLTLGTRSKLKIASLLGQGGFGRVLLVEHKHPHKLMALKAMSKKAVTDAKQEKTLLAERDCIEKFDHAFVVGFYGAFQDRDFVYLAIEYAAGGDLYSFMYEREEQSRRTSTATTSPGATSPENILFDPRGYVKLSDFGFAKEFVHEDHDGGGPGRTRIFDPTSMGASSTREFLACFETSLLHTRPPFRLGNGANGFASIKRHAFFHKVDPSEFAWAPLAACDAAALLPPRAPPAAANPLAPTNFAPDADAEGYDDTDALAAPGGKAKKAAAPALKDASVSYDAPTEPKADLTARVKRRVADAIRDDGRGAPFSLAA
ncbi:cGMP-dependent protein kinase [Aureococcus anophagefferens]|nr:cGMP-dependent protein kinase [Aureococcus anophagefferens]